MPTFLEERRAAKLARRDEALKFIVDLFFTLKKTTSPADRAAIHQDLESAAGDLGVDDAMIDRYHGEIEQIASGMAIMARRGELEADRATAKKMFGDIHHGAMVAIVREIALVIAVQRLRDGFEILNGRFIDAEIKLRKRNENFPELAAAFAANPDYKPAATEREDVALAANLDIDRPEYFRKIWASAVDFAIHMTHRMASDFMPGPFDVKPADIEDGSAELLKQFNALKKQKPPAVKTAAAATT
jgi:hypothetical protein